MSACQLLLMGCRCYIVHVVIKIFNLLYGTCATYWHYVIAMARVACNAIVCCLSVCPV